MLIAAIFLVVAVQLSNLTLAQAESLSMRSEDRKTRTLTLKGSRGQILDSSGIPLAYDQSSYDVEFTRDPSRNTTTDRAYYTDVLTKAIELIESGGSEIIDTFNIIRDDDGTYKFDFGVTNPDAVARREENWRTNMFVSKTAEPDVIYRDLRTRYRIPEEYTYEEARKLLSIWQEVQLSSYRAYVPVKIARDVPADIVALIEAGSNDLDGVSVAQSSTRIYPKDDVASHIIGYMGKMVDETVVSEMVSKGYSQDDYVGITGVENSMESFLTGNSTEHQGERRVEVNSRGKIINEQSYTAPTPGNDVVLTIDLELQMAAEEALENNINEIYKLQVEQYETHKDKYDNISSLQNRSGETTLDKLNLAKSGALIVMDVKNGNVLAMASYPTYNLNLFHNGISEEDYSKLLNDPRAPLFNKAIASKGIPGSIFKMVTGTAGLMENLITADTVINDEGKFDDYISVGSETSGIGNGAPSCWVDPYFDEHANNQTLVDALKVSCNYYFFRVSDMLGIDKIVEWADKFGLMSKTNIELPGEVTGQVGNQEVLYNPEHTISEQKTSIPYLVRNQILNYLKDYAEQREVVYEDELLEETADALVELIALNKTSLGPEIREILSDKLEIPETIAQRNGWDGQINDLLTQLQWNPTRTVLTGIGTNITSVTPIAVARYTASLVNGGHVYDAHIVDRVVDSNGNVVEDREADEWSDLGAPAEVLDLIKEGMREVVSAEDGGTAGEYFRDWKYAGQIGGKTGTGKVNELIDLENNAWFIAFAPYEDPEIAVVSYIPNGWGGSYAIPAARDIIEFYLDGKQEEQQQDLPAPNSIVI